MDAYNTFNHMAPRNPSLLCIDCTGAQGVITGLGVNSIPRQLDFAAKITF